MSPGVSSAQYSSLTPAPSKSPSVSSQNGLVPDPAQTPQTSSTAPPFGIPKQSYGGWLTVRQSPVEKSGSLPRAPKTSLIFMQASTPSV